MSALSSVLLTAVFLLSLSAMGNDTPTAPLSVLIPFNSQPASVFVSGETAQYRVSVFPQQISPMLSAYTFSIERNDGAIAGKQTFFCYDYRFPNSLRKIHRRQTLENCMDTQLTGQLRVDFEGSKISVNAAERMVISAETRDSIRLSTVRVQTTATYALATKKIQPNHEAIPKPTAITASMVPFFR